MSEIIDMVGGGKMRVWEENERIFFRCEHPMKRDGLYKVWLSGSGGEVLLGTLVPERDRLVLGRVFNREELLRQRCWPVKGAECRMVFRFQNMQKDSWYWEPCPQRYVMDELSKFGEWCGMLAKNDGEGIILAYPLNRNTSLPLVPLFCFAAPQQIRGELCLTWHFDKEGRPHFSQEHMNKGRTR